MRTPWAAALVILSWTGAASAEVEATLIQICGQTLIEDTVVREQGGGGSFGTCVITLASVRLRILQANLAGGALRVAGTGDARLVVVGTRLRADLEVSGTYQRVRFANGLVRAARAAIDLSAGDVQIRFGTFNPTEGEVEVSTDDGKVQVASTKFRGHATFIARPGGADLRLSEFLAGVDVTTLGPGDLAFLSNIVRGPADVTGDGRVVVAANTFERAGDGGGDVTVEGDIAFFNNLVEGATSLHSTLGLMVIGNTFESGRPMVDGAPPSCIVINNDSRVTCP